MTTKRNYQVRDVVMLTVVLTIIDAAIAHLSVLVNAMPAWAEPFFTNFRTRVNNAFTQYLGIDPKKALRDATSGVLSIFEPASSALAKLKTRLTVQYGDNKVRLQEILTTLGYNDYLKAIQGQNQEALVQFLFRFKTNLTDSLKAEIIAKGIAPDILTEIMGYAEPLKDADVTQESQKTGSMEITGEAVKEFNAIYKIAIGICKVATLELSSDPAAKAQFSFSALARKVSGEGKGENVKPETKPA